MTRALGSGSPEAYAKSDQDYADAYREACDVSDADAPEESARRIRGSPISAALTAAMYDWHVFAQAQRRRDWMLAVLRINDTDHGGWLYRSLNPAVWNDRDAVARLIEEFGISGQSPNCGWAKTKH